MNMPTIKITGNGAITLPAEYRKALKLKVGDFVNAELQDNRVVIRAARIIDADDAWFYTREWQDKEAEADDDIAAGRVAGPFATAEELRRDLDGNSRRRGK